MRTQKTHFQKSKMIMIINIFLEPLSAMWMPAGALEVNEHDQHCCLSAAYPTVCIYKQGRTWNYINVTTTVVHSKQWNLISYYV